MKEINEMSRKEVVDEMVRIEVELDALDKFFDREQVIDLRNDLFELDYALTHNFPKLI